MEIDVIFVVNLLLTLHNIHNYIYIGLTSRDFTCIKNKKVEPIESILHYTKLIFINYQKLRIKVII